jgi:integrase
MRGHVTKRGKAWAIVVDARGEDGRRRRRWISGTMHGGSPWRTRREAEEALADVLGKVGTHQLVEPSRLTLQGYLEVWLEGRRGSLRETTWDSYERALRVHVYPVLGAVLVQKLRASELTRLYRDLERGGKAKRTVRYVHTIVRKALQDGLEDDPPVVGRNIADRAKPPSAKETRAAKPRVWTADQTRAFFASVAEDRLGSLWIVLGTGGLRRGEALGLRRQDLDLDGGKITIRQALAPVGTRIIVSGPKTARSSRDVYLDTPTVAALRARLKALAAERLSWGPAYEDHGLVFGQEDGRPLVPGEVSKTFRRLVRRAGLPPIRLHDLRHGVATAWLEAGINPLLVSERLGHASAAFTLDVYSHVRPRVHQEAAAKVAEILFTEGGNS